MRISTRGMAGIDAGSAGAATVHSVITVFVCTDGFGAVVTIELKGGHDAVASFMNRLEVFTLAESLGGVESLAGHPATMSHSNQTA